jgi:hypothetical protein
MSLPEPYGWLDLQRAAAYCSLSIRKLREYLGHPIRPLPAHLVGGKWLIRREGLDDWLQGFPRAGEQTDRLVDELMQELTGDDH